MLLKLFILQPLQPTSVSVKDLWYKPYKQFYQGCSNYLFQYSNILLKRIGADCETCLPLGIYIYILLQPVSQNKTGHNAKFCGITGMTSTPSALSAFRCCPALCARQIPFKMKAAPPKWLFWPGRGWHHIGQWSQWEERAWGVWLKCIKHIHLLQLKAMLCL